MKRVFLLSGTLLISLVISAWPKQKALPLNPFGLDDPLIGVAAPELEISEWINGEGVTLKDLRGKVVVLEFFQMWCPGCNKFSIPLMKDWVQKFADEKDVTFLSIHTVFEGYIMQSPRRLKKFLKKKKIEHLVGIDRRVKGDSVPVTMGRYRTGGTPCMAILDKKGVVRFKYFGGFRKEPVEALILELLKDEFLAQSKPSP